MQRLSSHGVGYGSFTEQYLDSCGIFKGAVLSILATIAKQERIRLSERTIAGLANARREGRMGGCPRLVVNRMKTVQMDSDGLTLREIAEELDSRFRWLSLSAEKRSQPDIGLDGSPVRP